MEELKKMFKNPDADYGVYPFWFLNHRIEKRILRWQLKEMKENGVAGFFMHARSGLIHPKYLSKGWFETIRYIVKESEKININSEIYDEFDCPSGTAGEIIPLLYPQYRARFLNIWRKKVEVKTKFSVQIPEGEILKIFAIKDGKILDLTDKIEVTKRGFSYHLDWTSQYYYRTEEDYRHSRAITFIPELFVTVPFPGEWEVIIFYISDKQKPEFTHQVYLDVLNPEATDMFIKYTHNNYKRYVSDNFGKNLHYFFVDEPKMFSQFPWTNRLEDKFRKKYGYSLVGNLYHLVLDTDKESEKVRFHYRQILTELFAKSFVLRIKNWCNENNLQLVGHISPEEDISHEGYLLGSLMELLEGFDIPGTDIIIPAIGDEKHKLLNRTMIISSSVAERKGVPSLCESFGSSDWHFTPLAMKKITDWFFTLGINFVVPHAFFYSIDGLRKHEAGPSQFYQWTFWKYYRYYSRYVSRLSYIMQNTRPTVNCAFLYPVSTIWRILPDEKKTGEINKKIDDLTFSLLSNHYHFHFITEKDIKYGRVMDKGVSCGQATYSVILILKGTYISPDVRLRIEEFKKEGVDIIEFENIKEVIGYLSTKKLNSFEIKGSEREKIFAFEKKRGDSSFYLFMNTSDRRLQVEIEIKGKTGIEIWDCETGNITPVPVKISNGKTYIKPEFYPFQSLLLSTSKNIVSEQKKRVIKKRYLLKSEWEIREVENYLVLNRWKVRKEKKDMDVVVPSPVYKIFPEIFHGEWKKTVFGKIPAESVEKKRIEFKTKFRVKNKIKKIEILIEKDGIKGKHHIFINGKRIKELKRQKEYDTFNMKMDITSLIKKGENKISISLITDHLESGIFSPVILKGAFSLDEKNGYYEIITERRRLKTGSWVSQGFPFFSGTMRYLQRVKPDIDYKNTDKIFLNFPSVGEMVEVRINQKNAGVLMWHPFRIEVKDFLKDGSNLFEFLITNSNANLFLKKGRPSGILETPFLELQTGYNKTPER